MWIDLNQIVAYNVNICLISWKIIRRMNIPVFIVHLWFYLRNSQGKVTAACFLIYLMFGYWKLKQINAPGAESPHEKIPIGVFPGELV